ncbi:MAG: hypothetical protein IPL61_34455 [Myxococcales bacterium]|nr:hypothetical protein [Myxococcales bacterium]
MDRPRSPVHQIVNALGLALRGLGARPDDLTLERCGFAVHAALSAAGRAFHNHEHVLALADGSDGDPLDVVAALYHDAVYVQVDAGPPRAMAAEFEQAFERVDGGWRIRPAPTPAVADVLAVFGRAPGDVIGPFTGLNELASAVVMALHLAAVLPRWDRLTVAMAIEQTVPFRDDPAPALHDRAAALGVPAERLAPMMRQAVRFGNHDVENFALADPGRFLDNTWKLLPESNPALQMPTVYSVRDYRIALQKMEGFLAQLPAARVFHHWGGEPAPEVHAAREAQAVFNITLAVRYLRAKLYSIAVVEALCEATGGDVPLDYFMGGFPSPGGPEPERVEHYLPRLDKVAGLEPLLLALLAIGRASESSFDTGPSPLAAFLFTTCGEAALGAGVDDARAMFAGQRTARAFLEAQPHRAVAGIARAAAEVAETRAAALRALADELDPVTPAA